MQGARLKGSIWPSSMEHDRCTHEHGGQYTGTTCVPWCLPEVNMVHSMCGSWKP